jgi:hypothetical protein
MVVGVQDAPPAGRSVSGTETSKQTSTEEMSWYCAIKPSTLSSPSAELGAGIGVQSIRNVVIDHQDTGQPVGNDATGLRASGSAPRAMASIAADSSPAWREQHRFSSMCSFAIRPRRPARVTLRG